MITNTSLQVVHIRTINYILLVFLAEKEKQHQNKGMSISKSENTITPFISLIKNKDLDILQIRYFSIMNIFISIYCIKKNHSSLIQDLNITLTNQMYYDFNK